MAATCKRKRAGTYSRCLQTFIDLVESDDLRTSKEVKAVVEHVRNCFDTEDIFVDEDRAEHYISLAKYFPYERVFPWQEFVITLHCAVFWKKTGEPRWPDLFCMIGRGAGKDGTIALEAVALASPYNGIHGYDVDVCANNEEQALRPVLDIVNAFDESDAATKKKLKKYFAWKKESVSCTSTNAQIRGRTNNPKGKDGMRSGIVVFNEIHQYENYDNINVFTTGLGKHPHPRRSYFTTNGDVREGPLDDILDTAEGILFGGEPDNGLLPFICRLDSRAEVDDPANWEKANPSLPFLPHLMEETKKEYREWKQNPTRLPAFMTKRMNIPEESSEVKVTEYENIKATNRPLPDLAGWSCVAGIDFAKTTDWVSVDLHFKKGDMRYDINHSWLCMESKDIPRFKCPWKEWAEAGRLTLIDDVEIHPELVTEYLDAMKQIYMIRAVAIDDFRYALFSKALKNIGFEPKVRKNLKLIRPSDVMKVAPVIDSCFANQWLIWGDAPEFRWATNNAKLIRVNRRGGGGGEDMGNFVYGKIEAKSRKTDPFMAFVAGMTIENMIIERREGGRKRLDVAVY